MTEKEQGVPPSTGVERLEAVSGPHVPHSLAGFRTTSESQDDSAEFRDEMLDDTIELALTEEETLALSRAAAEELAAPSPDKSALIATSVVARDQTVRPGRWPLLLASSVLAIVIGTVIGVVSAMVADRGSMVTIKAPSAATRSAKPPKSPVRFSNPFDGSEVFEFPPGTSEDQARQSVAAILQQRALQQRARDRQGVGVVMGDQPPPGVTADR